MKRSTDINMVKIETKTHRTVKVVSIGLHFTGVASNSFCCSQLFCVDFKGVTVVRVYTSLNLAK